MPAGLHRVCLLCTVPLLQERYLYTPQRMQCWGFLSGKEICVANERMSWEQTVALHASRWSHLEAKRSTICTPRRRGQRWEIDVLELIALWCHIQRCKTFIADLVRPILGLDITPPQFNT